MLPAAYHWILLAYEGNMTIWTDWKRKYSYVRIVISHLSSNLSHHKPFHPKTQNTRHTISLLIQNTPLHILSLLWHQLDLTKINSSPFVQCFTISCILEWKWAFVWMCAYLCPNYGCPYLTVKNSNLLLCVIFRWMFGNFKSQPEETKRSSFQNVVLSNYLEFQTMDRVQKPSDWRCLHHHQNPSDSTCNKEVWAVSGRWVSFAQKMEVV
jgi:hypothetical protein